VHAGSLPVAKTLLVGASYAIKSGPLWATPFILLLLRATVARRIRRGVGAQEREGTTMHYVMLLRWKQGLTREQRDGALINRAGWKYPSGVEVVAEYWPSAEDPAVVSIFRTDDFGALMEIAFTWGAIFDITTLPAISAEDGLKIGPDVLGRRQF
jgi:hypothetical protein